MKLTHFSQSLQTHDSTLSRKTVRSPHHNVQIQSTTKAFGIVKRVLAVFNVNAFTASTLLTLLNWLDAVRPAADSASCTDFKAEDGEDVSRRAG